MCYSIILCGLVTQLCYPGSCNTLVDEKIGPEECPGTWDVVD